MTVLTFTEGEVVAVVRRQSRLGDPVPTCVVKNELWITRRIPGGSTQLALAGLVSKGVIVKPSRGYYLLAEREES